MYSSLFLSLGIDDEKHFITKLREWGLGAVEVEILSSRYLYGDSYADIAKAMGWKDMGKLHSTAQEAKAKIKAIVESYEQAKNPSR